jgi:hypothetical protein
MDFGGG